LDNPEKLFNWRAVSASRKTITVWDYESCVAKSFNLWTKKNEWIRENNVQPRSL